VNEPAAGTGALRVSVDLDRCCGAGSCVRSAPDVFDQDDDTGVVVLLDPAPAPEHAASVREALHLCSVGAITLDQS